MPTAPPPGPLDLLDPTNDLVFKLLLTGPGSRDVLAYVLRGVLGSGARIEDFVVLDPVLSTSDLDAKAIVFDVRVALADGTQVDVEMQCLPTRAFRERLVYYGARGLAQQLETGDAYGRLRPSIVVAFLGYHEFREPGFHKVFAHREIQGGFALSDVLVIHTLELPKLTALDARREGDHHPLVVFSRFLTARSRDALASLAEEEPAMKQAIDILQHLSSDAAVRRRAADREARIRLDEMYRRDEIEEVRAAALAEGRAEGEVLARAVLLRLLESRFGSLLDAQRRIVESASREQVERWAERALTAGSVADVLAS